ncbi:hypothetical protein PHISP_07146 [Aspergillus sp. HF37]|nr:hypothetical protein PHISP_07146 [Aspergillus sp. HF37]
MERRITRSVAAREAALLANKTQGIKSQVANPPDDQVPSAPKPRRKRKSLVETTPNFNHAPRTPKARRRTPKANVNELPHNLGPAPILSPTSNDVFPKDSEENLTKEVNLGKVVAVIQDTVNKATKTLQDPTEKNKKKHPYGLTPGYSPFPEWVRPTADECEEVNRLLSSVHGEVTPPKTIPEPSLTVTGCGEVPSVLDALIRTLLSGATTGNNSAMAFNGLVERFGILEEGIGKGSVNWDAVRQAPLKDVFEAIKSGGLADTKSKNLKAILDMVHKENQERRDLLLLEDARNEQTDSPNQLEGKKQYEVACVDQNFLSLNHLHSLTKEDAMAGLVKYPGIGPKTAACVVLFCLQRPCFAVDTHVFRICKWLGWIPPVKATEVTAFSHLEVRIPDHLKYSLHQLFIFHGKSCPRCRAITGQSSAGWEDGCVIDHLVTRSGKRKVGFRAQSKKTVLDEDPTGDSDSD